MTTVHSSNALVQTPKIAQIFFPPSRFYASAENPSVRVGIFLPVWIGEDFQHMEERRDTLKENFQFLKNEYISVWQFPYNWRTKGVILRSA